MGRMLLLPAGVLLYLGHVTPLDGLDVGKLFFSNILNEYRRTRNIASVKDEEHANGGSMGRSPPHSARWGPSPFRSILPTNPKTRVC